MRHEETPFVSFDSGGFRALQEENAPRGAFPRAASGYLRRRAVERRAVERLAVVRLRAVFRPPLAPALRTDIARLAVVRFRAVERFAVERFAVERFAVERLAVRFRVAVVRERDVERLRALAGMVALISGSKAGVGSTPIEGVVGSSDDSLDI